jgi:hypothetical protein
VRSLIEVRPHALGLSLYLTPLTGLVTHIMYTSPPFPANRTQLTHAQTSPRSAPQMHSHSPEWNSLEKALPVFVLSDLVVATPES